MNNNEKLIKQIAEIEKEQCLPAGYIAELLYQKAKQGYRAGTILKLIIDSSNTSLTFEEVAKSFAKMNTEEPSPEQIKQAYNKLRESMDTIAKPSDKAKQAMDKMGVKNEKERSKRQAESRHS